MEQAAAPRPAAAEAVPTPVPAIRAPAAALEPAAPQEASAPAAAPEGAQVYAGPAVRQLARELGVPLEQVPPTGPRGRIVKDDVKAFVKARMTSPPSTAAAGAALPALPVIDFSRFGPVETVPLSRIRVRGADNLHRSWVNVPHVTQHDEVDVTDLEAFRRALKAEAEAAGCTNPRANMASDSFRARM